MNEFLLASLLAIAPAPECCVRQQVLLAAPDEGKEARDNVGHFISPMVLTTSFYGFALYFGKDRKEARWISALASLGLVVLKEVYDERVAGRFGVQEVLIGVGGTATGLYLAERIEWHEEKRAR